MLVAVFSILKFLNLDLPEIVEVIHMITRIIYQGFVRVYSQELMILQNMSLALIKNISIIGAAFSSLPQGGKFLNPALGVAHSSIFVQKADINTKINVVGFQ